MSSLRGERRAELIAGLSLIALPMAFFLVLLGIAREEWVGN